MAGGTQVGSAYGKIVIDASGVQTSVGRANASIGTLTKSMGSATAVMGGALAVAAAALGAGLLAVAVSGVKAASSLEQQMANIQASMQISAQETEALRQKILELGLDPTLKVSATEAAQAIEALGRNGLTTTQILDGAARGTVLLANATGAQFGTAADIATDSMALFNIQASEMETAVNGITSVVNNSKFAVEDYAMAMAQGGGVASLSGVSFNDFNAAITAISPLFRSGSDAGTSFKTMLQRMAAPTAEAWATMKQLGLVTAENKNAFYDAEGNMRSMAEVAGLLNTATAGLNDQQMNQALTTIFGADAIRAAGGMARLTESDFLALQETMGETSAADAAAIRMNTLAGSLEILQGIIETLRIRIGDVFKGDLKAAVDSFSTVLSANADRIVAFFYTIRAVFMGFAAFVRAFFGGLTSTFGGRFNQISANANGWGRNIVMSLARGMAQAMAAVVQVLNQIGQVITHWLQPHSPPLIVPDIDEYGTGAMDAYLQGFLEADFGIFNDIAGTITGYLRSLGDNVPEGDLIPRIIGARSAIAEAIALMRETGTVSQASLDGIFASAGIADQALQNYVSTVLQLTQANDAVAAAQANVNAINEEYDAILGPLNAELEALRNQGVDARDDQELADIQKRLAEERLTDGEREALMQRQREIQLQQQIRAIEEQRDTAVEGAEEQLSAAEEAQAQIEAQAAAQQALIDAQIENNNLIQQQIDLLEQLAEAGGGGSAGGGLGDLAGGAGGLGEILGDGLEDIGDMGLGDALGGAIEDFADPFSDAIADLVGDIQAEFDPLIAAGTQLGTTWGGVLDAIGERFGEVDGLFSTTSGNIRTTVDLVRGKLQELKVSWQEGFDEISATTSTAWTIIQTAVGGALALLEPAISTFVTNVGEGLKSFEPALHSLGELWLALQPIISAAIGLIVLNILSFLGVVVGVVNGIAAAIQPFLTTIGFVVNGAITLLTGLIQFVTGFFQFLVGMNQDNNALVEEAWQRMGDGLTNIVTGLFEMIVGAFVGGIATVIALVDGFVTSVIAFFTDLYTQLVGASIVPDMVTAILQWFGAMVTGAVEFVTAMVTAVGIKFTELKALAIGKVEEMLAAIQGVVGRFRDVGAALIESMREGVLGAVGGLIAAASGAVQDALSAAWDALTGGGGGPTAGANNRPGNTGNSMQGAQSAVANLQNTQAALNSLLASMTAANMQAMLNNARAAAAPINNNQSSQTTHDNRKSSMSVVFNGRDRVGQATETNTLRAMTGGV